jgi:hypothetical protein
MVCVEICGLVLQRCSSAECQHRRLCARMFKLLQLPQASEPPAGRSGLSTAASTAGPSSSAASGSGSAGSSAAAAGGPVPVPVPAYQSATHCGYVHRPGRAGATGRITEFPQKKTNFDRSGLPSASEVQDRASSASLIWIPCRAPFSCSGCSRGSVAVSGKYDLSFATPENECHSKQVAMNDCAQYGHTFRLLPAPLFHCSRFALPSISDNGGCAACGMRSAGNQLTLDMDRPTIVFYLARSI